MNIINTIALAEQLKARTSLSDRDAAGIVQTIAEVADDRWSQLVTRDQLDARFAEQDAKFAELRADVATQIADLRTELRTEIGSVRGEMAELRAEFRTEFANVRKEMADLRAEVSATLRAQTMWLMGSMIALAGLTVAAAKLI